MLAASYNSDQEYVSIQVDADGARALIGVLSGLISDNENELIQISDTFSDIASESGVPVILASEKIGGNEFYKKAYMLSIAFYANGAPENLHGG